MNPPPPRLPADGCVTASARATATAASTALPPRLRMPAPTCEAVSLDEATMPCGARTGCGPPCPRAGAAASRNSTFTNRRARTKTSVDAECEREDESQRRRGAEKGSLECTFIIRVLTVDLPGLTPGL